MYYCSLVPRPVSASKANTGFKMQIPGPHPQRFRSGGLGLRPGHLEAFHLPHWHFSWGPSTAVFGKCCFLRVPQQSVFSSYTFLVYFYTSGGSTDSCTRLKSTKGQSLCLPFFLRKPQPPDPCVSFQNSVFT